MKSARTYVLSQCIKKNYLYFIQKIILFGKQRRTPLSLDIKAIKYLVIRSNWNKRINPSFIYQRIKVQR